MRKHLLFLSLLLAASLLLSGCASVEAQQKPSASNWSNPATWPDKKVPGKDAEVTIGKDMNVILDVSPPPLHGLNLNGKLSFADNKDLELTTEWIMLHGTLEIGSEAKVHTRNATITLTNNVPDENIMEMGDRGIMLMGGTLSLHGNRKDSWTKLTKTAAAGSNTIEVMNAGDWKKGDVIVVASTDYDPHQAERRTISSISGKVITLDQKLEYMHYGQVTFGVDERGEVGMISRNVKIQASADAEQSFSGGHVMAMAGSTMQVSGVEFFRMGQHESLARYPIHWHLVGDTQAQYIENSAIHDTYSRCVTVHGTNNVRVQNNVAYNNVGHCYFLEDGIEHGNQWSESTEGPKVKMVKLPPTSCFLPTTRRPPSGSRTPTIPTAGMCPRVLRQRASGWLFQNIQRVSLKARRSPRRPGPAGRKCGNFPATSPTPTSKG
jgi:cell migration-inducing and hyaluronan-binding protein